MIENRSQAKLVAKISGFMDLNVVDHVFNDDF